LAAYAGHTPAAWGVPVAIALIAALAAVALRRILRFGAPLLAGLVVGVALGPGVFGRVAPTTYVSWVDGGSEALERLIELRRESAALGLVAVRTEADASAEAARLGQAVADAEAAWRDARRNHHAPRLGLIVLLAAVVMAAGGAAGAGARLRSRPGGAEAILLGLWLAVPTALGGIAWMAATGESPLAPTALLLAAALAIGGWRIAGCERAIARTIGGRDAVAQASIASIVATGVAALAAASAARTPLAAAALVAAILPLALGALRPLPRPLARLAERVAVPGLIALATLSIEPFRDLAPWTMLVVFVVAEDGRWLALALGDWLAGGRGWLAAMRFALVPLAVGVPMAVVAAVGLALELLLPPVAFAILVAACLVEILAPVRLRLAREIEGVDRSADVGEDAP
jgi:hypothetical protein